MGVVTPGRTTLSRSFFDGSSLGNPGRSGAGLAVFLLRDGATEASVPLLGLAVALGNFEYSHQAELQAALFATQLVRVLGHLLVNMCSAQRLTDPQILQMCLDGL